MQQNMMGQNIIITEPSKNLRALGRNALAGKWKVAILAVVVYALCVSVPAEILNQIFGTKPALLYEMSYGYGSTMDAYTYNSLYNLMPSVSYLSELYVLLVDGAFMLGLSIFFLAAFRRQIVRVSDIFLGFERFGKALGLMLFQSLFVTLWSLLLIVPGVIALIRYSQAFFILADDPSKGIRQCMDESKMMMKGNKAKYFCLNLSFIGWWLLYLAAAILFGCILSVEMIFGATVLMGITVFIMLVIFMVGISALSAYMSSAQAGFYEILAGHLIKETEPAPVHFDGIPAAVPPVASSAERENVSVVQPSAQSESTQAAESPETQSEPVKAAQPSDDIVAQSTMATPAQAAEQLADTTAELTQEAESAAQQPNDGTAQAPAEAAEDTQPTEPLFPQEITGSETDKDAVSEADHGDDGLPKEV